MKSIMVLDSGDYMSTTKIVKKVTVRAVIVKDGRLLLQRDGAGVYKLPGGGVEVGEDYIDTLRREVLEEVGRDIVSETIEEIGMISEVRRDVFDPQVKFIRDTYFYKCDITDEEHELKLTQSEERAGFYATWADIDEIIEVNSRHGLKECMKRDTFFLKWYKEETEVGNNK